MLFKQSLALLAMSPSLTWAQPRALQLRSAATSLHEPKATTEALSIVPLEKPTLEERQVPDLCQIVQTAIQLVGAAPEEYKGEAIATTTGSLGIGFSAYFTCRAMNGQNCGDVAAAIGSGIATIGIGVSISLNMPIKGTEKVDDKAKRNDEVLAQAYGDRLRSLGHKFHSLEIIADSQDTPRDLSESGSAVDGMAGIKIRGLQHDENPRHVTDHDINFKNGTAMSRVTSSATDRSKRENGDAFKMSYDFHQIESVFPADEEGIKALADSAAADWQKRADEDYSMGEYFADLSFGGHYKMAMHITPETGSNWSTEWEDPKQCGTI